MSMSMSVVGVRGTQETDWRRLFSYGVALMLAAALHFAVWQLKGELAPRPAPKPKPDIMEVALVAAPAPSGKAPEPAPQKAEPKPAEPKKVEPKPVPRPKPPLKPKPPPKPRAEPKPEPAPPLEKPAPVESEAPPPRAEPPSVPEARAAKAEDSSAAAKSRSGDSVKEGGGQAETFENARADAAYLHNPKPEYPTAARHRHWEGKVVLRVKVLPDGRCGQADVHQGSGHEMLDEAALEAVRNWRFVPAKRNGQPVESWVNIPIKFNLE